MKKRLNNEVTKMDNENLLKMAQLISELRKEKNLTQKGLAEQLGVTDKAVSKWERGLSSPDISLLPKLSLALGITTNELLSGERNNLSTSDNEVEVGAPIQNTEIAAPARKDWNKRWKFLVPASAAVLSSMLILFVCNLAIEGGTGWAMLPQGIVFFIWLAVILCAYILGKKRISSTLFCSSLIYFSTFYYSSLNETPTREIFAFNGFPKDYIPHYTIIIVTFIASVVLLIFSFRYKKNHADKAFHLASASITMMIISILTISAIMDYADINYLGVDGKFTILLLLSVIMNSISLAIITKRQWEQTEKSH
jgi:transcriptional regulator with XRE-family HTH domain